MHAVRAVAPATVNFSVFPRFCQCLRRLLSRRSPLAGRSRGRFARELRVTEAVADVVVDHPRCLHEGIADGGSHEAKAESTQIAAHGVRLGRCGRNVSMTPPVRLQRLAPDKAPNVSVERSLTIRHPQKCARIRKRALDLEPITYDAGIHEQLLDTGRREPGDTIDFEVGKRLTISITLLQNRRPAESGLRSLQRQQLEECRVVVLGHAPFPVVVLDVQLCSRPRAALHRSGAPRRQAPRHNEIALPIVAEQELLIPDGLEALLLVERNGAGVLLPDSEPEYIGAPCTRRRDRLLHEGGTQTAAVPTTIRVEAHDLDRTLTDIEGHIGLGCVLPNVYVARDLPPVVDRQPHAPFRLRELGALTRLGEGAGEISFHVVRGVCVAKGVPKERTRRDGQPRRVLGRCQSHRPAHAYSVTRKNASENRRYTASSKTPSNQVVSASWAMEFTMNAEPAIAINSIGLLNTRFIGRPSRYEMITSKGATSIAI